jgi:hypothetical protein
MSSNGGSDLANKYPAGAYADSASGNKHILTTSKRLLPECLMRGQPQCSEPLQPLLNLDLSHPLPPLLPMPLGNYPSPTPLMLSLTITLTTSLCFESLKPSSLGMRTARAVASGTVTGSQEEARPEELLALSSWPAPASLVSPSDIGFCAQCHGPREYCHGHKSPAPTPVPAPVTPTPVPAPSTRPLTVGHFRLTREEAISLADNIANALEVCHEDTPEVLLPYPEGAQAAEGMGIQCGRGQRGRPCQPIAVHYANQTTHLCNVQRGGQTSCLSRTKLH